MEEINTKICAKCKKEKPFSDFYLVFKTKNPKLKSNYQHFCKDCQSQYAQNWRKKNLDKCRESSRRHRKNDPTYQITHNEYRRRPQYRKRRNEHLFQKRRTDSKFRLNHTMSSRIYKSLKRNKNGYCWEVLVGYSCEKLKKHLEKQFQLDMSWDNYGDWHIDHIIPVSAFNFTKPEDIDFKRCWSLKNLRPMWAEENMKKKAKLNKPFQPSLAISPLIPK